MKWLMLSLFQNALAGCVAIAALLLFRFLVGKRIHPQWRYRLWSVALICLLLPVRFPSPTSLLNVVPEQAAESVTIVQNNAEPQTPYMPTYVQPVLPYVLPQVMPDQVNVKLTRMDFLSIAFFIWLAGAVVTLSFFIIGNIRFYLSTRHSYKDEKASALLFELCKSMGMRRSVTVRVCAGLPSPCMTALFPKILLNEKALENEECLRYILLHELSHIRQRDIASAWLWMAAQVTYWFHPLVWIAAREARRDAELSCDAAVMVRLSVNQRISYGMTLLRMLPGERRTPLPVATNLASGRKLINERIRIIARMPRKRLAVALPVAAVAIVLAACTLTGALPKLSSDRAEAMPMPSADILPKASAMYAIATTQKSMLTAAPTLTFDYADYFEPIDLRYLTGNDLLNNPNMTEENLINSGLYIPDANDRYEEARQTWLAGSRPELPPPLSALETGFAILPANEAAYGNDCVAILPKRALTDEEMLWLVDAFGGKPLDELSSLHVWIAGRHEETNRLRTESEAERYYSSVQDEFQFEKRRAAMAMTEDLTKGDIAYVPLNPDFTNGLEEVWFYPNYEMTDEQILMAIQYMYRDRPESTYTPADTDLYYKDAKAILESTLWEYFPEAERNFSTQSLMFASREEDVAYLINDCYASYFYMKSGLYEYEVTIDKETGEFLDIMRLPRYELTDLGDGRSGYVNPVIDLTAQYEAADSLVREAAQKYADEILARGETVTIESKQVKDITPDNNGECVGFTVHIGESATYQVDVMLCNLDISRVRRIG